jgi:hypothetical protein
MALPKQMIHVLRQFEEVFSERVWEWAKVFVIGAILAPGERTVAAVLRVLGRSRDPRVAQRGACVCSGAFTHPFTAPAWGWPTGQTHRHDASISVVPTFPQATSLLRPHSLRNPWAGHSQVFTPDGRLHGAIAISTMGPAPRHPGDFLPTQC